ncbi:TIR domain-containing protein [Amycolatopsis sp. NBC_00345]|uniref:TIR domain-containing protein n=1 Tax=Amycolatopsis sp. NBC_00345 TaxID=2975955 RepID=UPI002E26E74A
MTESAESYDFCLSFASEQRPYAEEVAGLLRAAGLRVFYDSDETASLLGADLYTRLDDVYNRLSRFCVLFASEAYARKMWTSHERASAQDRAIRSATAYVLPVRFDDTDIPGLRGTTGFVDARRVSPAGLVRVLVQKLEREPVPATEPASVVALAADGADDGEPAGVLGQALAACRVDVAPEPVARMRAVAVVPERLMPAADVVGALLPALERLVAARQWQWQRLRIAVHRAELPAGHGLACLDVTFAVEAAISAAVTGVFDAAPRAKYAVVVTQRVYDSVVRPGRGGGNPALYHLVTTADGTGLHVRVPGYPRPLQPDRPPSAAERAAGGTKNTFFGGVRAGHVGDITNVGGVHLTTNDFGGDDD